MESQGNLEKDIAVQAVQMQVLSRDLERLRQDLEDYKKENDPRVEGLQKAQTWILGASAVVGGILTVGGSSIIKWMAGLIAKG